VELDARGIRWTEGFTQESLPWDRVRGYVLERKEGRLFLRLIGSDQRGILTLPFVTPELLNVLVGPRGLLTRRGSGTPSRLFRAAYVPNRAMKRT
jgi:hypothetical protein